MDPEIPIDPSMEFQIVRSALQDRYESRTTFIPPLFCTSIWLIR